MKVYRQLQVVLLVGALSLVLTSCLPSQVAETLRSRGQPAKTLEAAVTVDVTPLNVPAFGAATEAVISPTSPSSATTTPQPTSSELTPAGLTLAKDFNAEVPTAWFDLAGELVRARLTAKLGADLAADLEPVYPATNPTTASGAGLPAGTPPPPNGWGSPTVREALQLVEGLLGGPAKLPMRPAPPLGVIRLNGGASNQWVVDGKHSATGKPLLANDTHMPVAMPALWYQVHLVGGRYNVTGTSFPGTPGVVVGHNEHCAWGLTIAWHDVQDLYVEKINPANPHEVEFEGRWEPVEVVQEIILVKDRPEPVVEEVLITRHGPIISKLVGEEKPLALRWVALERSDLLRAVLEYDRAGNDRYLTFRGRIFSCAPYYTEWGNTICHNCWQVVFRGAWQEKSRQMDSEKYYYFPASIQLCTGQINRIFVPVLLG